MTEQTPGGPLLVARVVAGVSAFWWAFLFLGLIDLAVPVEETFGLYESYPLETGWGLLYAVLVGAAFVTLVVRPRLVMPVVQVMITAACLLVTAVAA